MTTRLLTNAQAETKCRIGQRALCCSFLVGGPDGLECGFVLGGSLVETLKQRQRMKTMTALSGPCADPLDDHSVAKDPV